MSNIPNSRRQQDRKHSKQYSTQSPERETRGFPSTYNTSGNTNDNHDRSNIRVVHNTIHGSQHVSTSHNSSTTIGSYNTQNFTNTFSHNTDSNHWDSNNHVEGNIGSFNETDFQQVMSPFGPNAMPLPAHVPENFTSGSWYPDNHNSNYVSSGSVISNNRDSFNATARERFTANSTNTYQSLRNRANTTETPRYNMNQHQSTTSHNNQLPSARRQSGSTVWSNNVNSNHSDSNNRIEGNARAFNGVSMDQNPISAITGARARNNPFAQNVPLDPNAAGGITAYSHNENSNHFNSHNNISNNTDAFNSAGAVNPQGLNLQQVEHRNQTNPRESPRYNVNQHRSTTSHNSQGLNAQRQSGSTVWSNNVNSNHSDSNNRIEGNARAFNGASMDQNPMSAITGARARNNPFAQNVPLDPNAAGGITAYSHNENSNHFNSRNNISNNTDAFNSAGAVNPQVLDPQQLEQVVAACRSLGYTDEQLQDLRLEYWHHEVLKLCLGDNGRSADQAAHDLHRLMGRIGHRRAKGRAIPSRKPGASFDATYQKLLH